MGSVSVGQDGSLGNADLKMVAETQEKPVMILPIENNRQEQGKLC